LNDILSNKDAAAADAGTDAGKIARSIGCSIAVSVDCNIVRSIVGTWRLAMTRVHDDAGKPMHAPYGPIPMGVVMFSADGRMVAVLCDARPQLPADEEEREYSSYCGNYTTAPPSSPASMPRPTAAGSAATRSAASASMATVWC
jgi:hypothetical protein